MARSTREVLVERDDVSVGGLGRNRWDRDRFDAYRGGGIGLERGGLERSRERDIDIHISDNRGVGIGGGGIYEGRRAALFDERERERERERDRLLYERDRYGPIGGDRRYWEEPTRGELDRMALAPYRGGRELEYERGYRGLERPGLLRRQSSLDTFDRRPLRYEREREELRGLGYGGYGGLDMPYRRHPRYEDGFYDDIRFRERERERDLSPGWEEEYRDVRVRRRGTSRRRRGEIIRRESISSSSSSETAVVVEDTKSITTVGPVLIGKRGKTRMPKRLVHKQAIIDLGLPYEEEEHFIIVRRALEKHHIDDVIRRSEGYRDTRVTYKFEEIRGGDGALVESALGGSETVVGDVRSVSRGRSDIIEGGRTEILDERRGTLLGGERTVIADDRTVVGDRSVVGDRTVIGERSGILGDRTVVEDRTVVSGERVDRRSDREIRDEIRALEIEREALKLERRADRRFLEADRYRDTDVEIIENRGLFGLGGEEIIKVDRDRRGRMALVAKRI